MTPRMNCVDIFRYRPHYMERLFSAATDDVDSRMRALASSPCDSQYRLRAAISACSSINANLQKDNKLFMKIPVLAAVVALGVLIPTAVLVQSLESGATAHPPPTA